MRVLVAALLALSCVNVADGRATRDETIGRAEAGGFTVAVQDGLAAVRSIEPARIHLWASAPTLSVHVRGGRAEGFELWVDNAMPDAVLGGSAADGTAVVIDPLPFPRPTRHRYRVRAATQTDILLRLASPDADRLAPFRFAIFADVQEAIDGVGDIFLGINADPSLRFCLISGDLTQRGSTSQLLRFQREMESLGIPAFATVGNHELGEDPPPFQHLFGRTSFHFDFSGAHFSLLDSASATLAPRVYDWLDGWLAHAAPGPHAVVMHIPPLDPAGTRNGAFASRGEAGKLLATLARGGVDLTVYGHVHSYSAFENAGIPAFISGGGGAIPERLDGIGRHFLAVDVDPTRGTFEVALVHVD